MLEEDVCTQLAACLASVEQGRVALRVTGRYVRAVLQEGQAVVGPSAIQGTSARAPTTLWPQAHLWAPFPYLSAHVPTTGAA